MSLPKPWLSLRVSQELKAEMVRAAEEEHRTLASMGELLVVWAFKEYQKVGDLNKLLRREQAKGAKS